MTARFEKIAGPPSIAVDVQGDTGSLVLFMHGIGGNRRNWHNQLPAFAGSYRAVAWDARGYGDSDDYEGALDFSDFAEDLLRVLDHFGVEDAHLVGLSMGGRIAMDFYDSHPERVRSLVLCDSLPGFESISEEQRHAFVASRRDPLLAGQELSDIAPVVAKTLVSATASPEIVQQLIDSMSMLRKESYIKAIEGLVFYPKTAKLEEVRVPTLFLVGSDDRLTPPELSKDMAARVSGAEYVEIPDAGHLTNLEKPEIFNRAVLEFLERV